MENFFKEHSCLSFKNNTEGFNFTNFLYEGGVIRYDLFEKLFEELPKEVLNIIFILSDLAYDKKCPKHVAIFCTSNNGLHKNVYTLPYFLEEHNKNYNPIYTELPRISFCGALTHPRRYQCLKSLQDNILIETDFIIRKEFWGGKPHDKNIVSAYNDNIKNSTYVLCNRGNGNYSMRLYHTLEAGRIPVMLRPSNPLPFEGMVDYEDCIIFCDSPEEMPKKILENHSKDSTIDRQLRCRKLYENFLSSKSFERSSINFLNLEK